MAEQNLKVATPAYVSYKSFVRFINGLRDHLPSRIDRSILAGMSGSGQSALIGSLEFLGLIDQGGKPQPALEDLIALSGAQYNAKLKELLTASYGFLFEGGIDLKRATGSQVHEAFRKKNVQGSTAIKAIAFFLAAAKDAAIEVSKHVKPPGAIRSPTQRRAGQRGAGRLEDGGEEEDEDQGQGGGAGLPSDVHPALAGILMQLPPSGETLSKRDRDRFMKAFEAVLTLVYPTDDDDELLK
jgi:hypothetical protein